MKAAFPGLAVPDPVKLNIEIHLSGEIVFGSQVARQRVTHFVVSHIGNMLCAGEPELVVSQRFFWRVPVLLTWHSKGVVGQVGTISVDVQTGELGVDQALIERMKHSARALVAGSPLPTG